LPQNEQKSVFGEPESAAPADDIAPAATGDGLAASILAERIFQLSYPNAFAISSRESL
jgi:hypothetical protein